MLASSSIQSALLPPTTPASAEISASGTDPATGFEALLAAIVPSNPATQSAVPVAALPPSGNPLPVSVAAEPVTPDFILEAPRSVVPTVPVGAAQSQPNVQQQPQVQPGAVLPRALAGTALSRIASTQPDAGTQPVATLATSEMREAPVAPDAAPSQFVTAPILTALNPDTVPIQLTAAQPEPVAIANETPRALAAAPIDQPVRAQVQAPTAAVAIAVAAAPHSAPVVAAPTAPPLPPAAPVAPPTQPFSVKPATPGLRRLPKANPAEPAIVQPEAQHSVPARINATPTAVRPTIALPVSAQAANALPPNLQPKIAQQAIAQPLATIPASPIQVVPIHFASVQIVPIHTAPVEIIATTAPATPVLPTPVKVRPGHSDQGNPAHVTQAPGLIRAAAKANPAAGLAPGIVPAPRPLATPDPVLLAEVDPATVSTDKVPLIAARGPGRSPAHQPAAVATDLRIDGAARAVAPTAQLALDPAKLRPVPVSDAITPLTALPVEPAPAVSAYIGPARSLAEGAQPLDFAALIDRIESAREAGGNAPVTFSLRHEEFGPVGLRIETDAGRISVDVSSPDPDFARAVAAAQPATNDTARSDNGRADSGRSDSSRADTSARGQESSTGNPRDGGGTGRGSSDDRGNRSAEARRSAANTVPGPDQTDLFA